MHQYGKGTDPLEGSSAHKDLGDLVDTKLTTSQRSILVAKAANRNKGGDPSSLVSTGEATSGVPGPMLGSPQE